MSQSLTAPERDQSRSEEIANSVSHSLGLVAALAASPFLIARAVRHGSGGYLVGASVFAATMSLLYLASALYHALPSGNAKRAFQVIEHVAIYLLIAGTYTPFTLGVLRGAWGWTLFGLVWGFAAAGTALKIFVKRPHPVVSTGSYLLMGFLIVVAVKPLYARVPVPGLLWIIAGGAAYTGGVCFFVKGSRLRYGHFIWHLFVMAGTACHYFAVLWYSA
ncbi:MAG: PAQR family membrane homeostasis protein TrhA [Nitrospirota bacterium]